MTPLFAVFAPGPWELAIIAIVCVLLFGARLPYVARSFGQSVMELKRGFLEVQADCEEIESKIKSEAGEVTEALTK